MIRLQQWKREKFGYVLRDIEKLREELETLNRTSADHNTIRGKMAQLDELLYREEMMWLQRSRLTWLKEGERNTKYLHRRAVWRARRNLIQRLRKDDGSWCSVPTDMERMAASYFKEVYTKDPTLTPEVVLDCINTKVTDVMNESLDAPFTEKEISDALFQIGPLKASGPDGFPARFIQRNWLVFKEEVIAAVLEFFRTGVMTVGVNETAIVLIPKVPHPTSLKDFRPISLCNVIYKIVSKCMVNRLRPLLAELILENQSAFIPGCLISDNSIIAFECAHHIQSLRPGAPDFCAYKLDLSKAYDRVDWLFLEKALLSWGFSHSWVSRVMACVSSVSYSVKFNGKLLLSFVPSKGLRQGDPLSPFLFLFVDDALSSLVNKAIVEDGLVPVRIFRNAPAISHLLFADDSLLFFRATGQQAAMVKGLLNTYALSTGQLINPSKCSILFSDNCSAPVMIEVKQILEVTQEVFEPKYLGLPVPEGRMHKGRFESVMESIRKVLVDWSEQFMSVGNKEILIKSVAQAIPTYVMSVFRLPASVCDEMSKLMRQYWWGVENGKHKMPWLSWDKMALPKSKGGMGFRDMRAFNQALLEKQAWGLLDSPDSLVRCLLRAKYFPHGNLIDTVFTGNASAVWRGIEHGLELVKKGVIWRVGNGTTIRAWRDPWIPRGPSFKPVSQKRNSILNRVSDFLNEEGDWNRRLLMDHFLPLDVHEIMKIRTSPRQHEDFLAWQPDKFGKFSVKSAYHLAMREHESEFAPAASSSQPSGERSIWNLVWKTTVPQKMKIIAWRVATGSLPTVANLHHRQAGSTTLLLRCGRDDESGFHAVILCDHAKELWEAMRIVWPIPSTSALQEVGEDWLLNILSHCVPTTRDMVVMLI